jgi:hypothetical protein
MKGRELLFSALAWVSVCSFAAVFFTSTPLHHRVNGVIVSTYNPLGDNMLIGALIGLVGFGLQVLLVRKRRAGGTDK